MMQESLIVTPKSSDHPHFGKLGKVVSVTPESPNIKETIRVEVRDKRGNIIARITDSSELWGPA